MEQSCFNRQRIKGGSRRPTHTSLGPLRNDLGRDTVLSLSRKRISIEHRIRPLQQPGNIPGNIPNKNYPVPTRKL
jgi:hypothetical protein